MWREQANNGTWQNETLIVHWKYTDCTVNVVNAAALNLKVYDIFFLWFKKFENAP